MSKKSSSPPSCLPAPEQIVLAATAIALAVTEGRTIPELESLVVLLGLIKDNVQSVLAQRLIIDKQTTIVDLNI